LDFLFVLRSYYSAKLHLNFEKILIRYLFNYVGGKILKVMWAKGLIDLLIVRRILVKFIMNNLLFWCFYHQENGIILGLYSILNIPLYQYNFNINYNWKPLVIVLYEHLKILESLLTFLYYLVMLIIRREALPLAFFLIILAKHFKDLE
jgi:hypothetical protein